MGEEEAEGLKLSSISLFLMIAYKVVMARDRNQHSRKFKIMKRTKRKLDKKVKKNKF